jgi:hypothetical protein
MAFKNSVCDLPTQLHKALIEVPWLVNDTLSCNPPTQFHDALVEVPLLIRINQKSVYKSHTQSHEALVEVTGLIRINRNLKSSPKKDDI